MGDGKSPLRGMRDSERYFETRRAIALLWRVLLWAQSVLWGYPAPRGSSCSSWSGRSITCASFTLTTSPPRRWLQSWHVQTQKLHRQHSWQSRGKTVSVPLSEFQAKTQQCGSIAKKCPCWSLPYVKSVPTTIGITASTAKRNSKFQVLSQELNSECDACFGWCVSWQTKLSKMQTSGVCTQNQSAFQNSCHWCFFGEVALAIFLHQPGCCHGRGAELPTLLPRFLLQIGISKWCLNKH